MDNISLLSHKHHHTQEKLGQVAVEAEKTGFRINTGKILHINNKQQDPIRLQQEEIREVDKFTCQGSIVSKDDGLDDNI